jgi:Ca-activated chloride channel family protein
MSFLHAYVLLLLVVPAALLYWVWGGDRRRVVLPFDYGRAGSGRWWRFALNLAESVPPLALAVVVVMLAGPQRLGEPETKRALTNIEFCVDVSGSMTAQFGDGTRYDASMKAIDQFLTFRKGDAFGLTFFGHNVLHWCPLTTDVSALRCAPPFMRPEVAPPWMGGTMIGKALMACKQILATRQEGDRLVVLISDGDSSDLYGGATEDIIKALKAEHVTVFAIIIGEDRIQDEMVEITHQTGGEAFDVGDPAALQAVFKRIDSMKQTKLEKTIAETKDDFIPWCVAGLALVGVCSLSLYGLRATPW